MDRPTYNALNAIKSFDSAERALEDARIKLDTAARDWARSRRGVANTLPVRDIVVTLRNALALTGDLVDTHHDGGLS